MEIKSEILERHVLTMIKEVMVIPENLKQNMDFFKRRTKANQLKLEKELREADINVEKAHLAKNRIRDLYTSGEIEKDEYVKKSLDADNEVNRLKAEKVELIERVPLLHKKELIDTNIKEFCETARVKFEKCNDFESQRSFVLEYVNKILYWNDKIEFHGSVPIRLKTENDEKSETAKIDFCIKDTVTMKERLRGPKSPIMSSTPITRKEHDLLVEKN